MTLRTLLLAALPLAVFVSIAVAAGKPIVTQPMARAVSDRLIAKYGEAQAARIRTGVAQVAARWWDDDGDSTEFGSFCEKNFLTDEHDLDDAFARLQSIFEQIDGHLHEVRRLVTAPLDLETGPISRLDRALGNVDLQSHVEDDMFTAKVAFVALLNFPVHTLQQRLQLGPNWSRQQWARSRMMDRFDRRVPAAVNQEVTRAFTAADQYISEYDIRMDRIITPAGTRPFPEGMHLVTHWGLRDQLGAQYGQPGGVEKQRIILKIMERIVRQEIPAAIVDNPDYLWCPETNAVKAVGTDELPEEITEREPDTRYDRLLAIFRAVRKVDAYSPTAQTYIARKFDIDRQIPEAEVEKLIEQVLSSQEVKDLARRIPAMLGRPLEPFDIWYTGFKPRSGRSEEELNQAVKERYPTVASFQAGLPAILKSMGFSVEKAKWLSDRIVVDSARGAGHAMAAERREDKAHLRTRIPEGGMDYQGYNIAIHELGHNVEQVFSLDAMDQWFLKGVPNNAFTESFAFTFQERDLEVLGLEAAGSASRQRQALATLWTTYEIGGVGLVDMKVWRWMYRHPDATPAELREATLAIAKEVWNKYYAPVFGMQDQDILAVYSHMIEYGLYLPDYSLGHIISFQVATKLHAGDFGAEFERMARQGNLTPDAWMRGAVGSPLLVEPLLAAARKALAAKR